MIKKVIFFIILASISLLLFFILWFSNKSEENLPLNNEVKLYWLDWKHLWKDIKDILNKDNYEKIWIDPEKYKNFEEFLLDFKTFSWVTIDPINEKFSISIKNENWDMLYIPYNFQKNKENFDNEVNKNLAILDIYNSYKDNLIYWWYNSDSWARVIYEWDLVHPLTDTLLDIFSSKINIFDIINDFNKSEFIWKENTELLSYLYDLVGDYDSASKNRDSLCIDYDVCNKTILLKISWKVVDSNWDGVNNAKIISLNQNKILWYSNEKWEYNFSLEVFPFTHLRFKSSLEWYSDWFVNYSINDYYFPADSKNVILNYVLNTPTNVLSISQDNKLNYIKWWYYLLENDLSKYFIPIDWLYFQDWTKYIEGWFDIYLYQFTKWSNMDNLLENDTFEPVYWYVWNIMKTFWMPYIQIIDKKTKKELFTKSSNPIILQNQVYHMKELYSDYDKLYWAITDEDMKYLVKYSLESQNPYPIDFDFLTSNDFLRWPARWSLDRETWVWSNVWHRVLNEWWLVELPFYHLKDN